MPYDVDDDAYVASLLVKEAKESTKRYELVGLDLKKTKPGPKPNKSFLRNIIRQTDSHNANLLAKEAEESRLRLERMERARRGEEGYGDRNRSSEKDDLKKKDSRRCGESRRHDRDDHRSSSRSKHHRKDYDRSTRRDRHDDDGHRDSSSRNSRSDHHRTHRARDGDRHRSSKDHSDRKHRRHRYSHRSHSRSRSRSPRRDTKSKSRHYRERSRSRSRSRSPKRSPRESCRDKSSFKIEKPRKRNRSLSSESLSDPLEDIMGPLLPPKKPEVRSRGRGTQNPNVAGIEDRFSTNYDPSADTQAPDGGDEWGDSVEAFRDRQKWKQLGVDRLRAARFSEEQITKWEKGGEPDEEDVVWAKKGQSREWDRGKVLDDEGNVELKAQWGRLT